MKKNQKPWVWPIAFVQTTILECPKCGSKLRSNPGEMPPLYFCLNCGYQGAIGLEPKEKKKK